MSILDKINQVKPSTWDNIEIPSGKNYVTITLKDNSQEYLDVVNILKNNDQYTNDIKKVERVQHPFAYGNFLIRKKQLKMQGYGEITPGTVIINVKDYEISDALKYNLDKRRINYHYYKEHEDYQIIAKCLRSSDKSIQRDSEIYPEYVVEHEYDYCDSSEFDSD